MTRIDLTLVDNLPPQNYGFEEGAADFLSLLEQLRAVRGFDVDWNMRPERDGPIFSLWGDREAYLDIFREMNTGETDSFVIRAPEASEEMLYVPDYNWRTRWIDQLSCEIYHSHPQYGTDVNIYIGLIDAVTRWKRPQHLAFGPGVYMRDHHPLDRARVGIRWIGWLPFVLNASDVPEAERVQPMNGGTLVVTQSAFWQAVAAHPAYSRAAIERAQDVEIRLNLLGVLPTATDLRGGVWGR